MLRISRWGVSQVNIVKSIKNNIKPIMFYITFTFYLIAYNLTGNGYDYDLWARLIVGKYFIQTGHVLKQDFLSYTPTHMWYDHEWGSGVVFYIIQKLFSNIGLFATHIILILLIYVLIIKIIKLRGLSNTTPYNLLFYILSFAAMSHLTLEIVRCQLFTFVFFVTYLYILELARKGNNKGLWFIPPIMLVWNNMHGGCTAGIGLLVLYIIGELLNKKSIKKYVLTFLVTILMLPINPWGISYLLFLLKATTMNRVDVVEWLGLFAPYNKYNHIEFKMLFPIMIFFEMLYIYKSIKEKVFDFDKTKYLTVLFTWVYAFWHVKLIPLCIIVSTAFLYDDFYIVFNFITCDVFNKIAKIKDILVYTFVLIYLSIFTFIYVPKHHINPFINWTKYPISIIEFIKINNLKGKLFINYAMGSYAGYKLYPYNKTFIDGRYEEVYYDSIIPVLQNFMEVGAHWDDLLKNYPPDIIVVERFYPIFNAMLSHPDWRQIFQSDYFALFVKVKDLKKEYKIPTKSLEDYQNTIFDTDIDFKDMK